MREMFFVGSLLASSFNPASKVLNLVKVYKIQEYQYQIINHFLAHSQDTINPKNCEQLDFNVSWHQLPLYFLSWCRNQIDHHLKITTTMFWQKILFLAQNRKRRASNFLALTLKFGDASLMLLPILFSRYFSRNFCYTVFEAFIFGCLIVINQSESWSQLMLKNFLIELGILLL